MKQLLVVDDEETFLSSLVFGLQKKLKKIKVLTAHNGKEALEVLQSNHVDLVLTDLQMPIMNGFQLMAVMNSQYSSIPVIVMTAFGTPDIEKKLRSMSSMNFLEKPIDFGGMIKKIKEVLTASAKGFIQGITLPTFVQLMEMEGKSCTLHVRSEGKSGRLFFFKGELIDARTARAHGEEAALEILAWNEVEIELKTLRSQKKRHINLPLSHVLMNSAIQQDEKDYNEQKEIDELPGQEEKEDLTGQEEQEDLSHKESKSIFNGGSKMKEALARLKDLDGFIAAGAFSADGEMLAEVSSSDFQLAEVGALANDVLLKAQKSTDIMGVGRGNVIHITAPKANVLVRCLNENTDFSVSEAGRAHVHLVLVLAADGNIALGKMMVEKVILKIAESIR